MSRLKHRITTDVRNIADCIRLAIKCGNRDRMEGYYHEINEKPSIRPHLQAEQADLAKALGWRSPV